MTSRRKWSAALVLCMFLLTACGRANKPMVGETAPAVQGGEWVQSGDTTRTVTTEGRWVVAAFLIPT